jgi:hypothetical protein
MASQRLALRLVGSEERDEQQHQQCRHRAGQQEVGNAQGLAVRCWHQTGPQEHADQHKVEPERDASGNGQSAGAS